jgi:23S rRNA (uracil1939-C5)-methyltransferase/tRNA (uracil-5-)-methyltransferase
VLWGVAKKKKFNDRPFAYHQEIELEISTLTNLGSGLGRVALPETEANPVETPADAGEVPADGKPSGWVVMVPFALPGERVRARVFRNHKNFSEADLVEVLTPSPHRVAPRCALYGCCGGCQYQHLDHAEQLLWKQRQVDELLRHMAGVEFPVSPVIGTDETFGYRSKITPHFNHRMATGRRRSCPSDFCGRARGSTSWMCRVARSRRMRSTRGSRRCAPRCVRVRSWRVQARGDAAAARGERQVTADYDATIVETVGDVKLRFLARDFFQTNPYILPKFTGYVREQAAASGARFLVDAYCGSGLFALTSAPAFERVAGIEISATSVAFATQNAAANGRTNATFQAGDASAIFAGLAFPPAETVVVIDPPRKGCDESFLNQLFAFGPRAVVYVSCDPATQMRDLKSFLAAGYELTAVQPFDLFPQTRHLECVITLRKSGAAQ